ncbi:MAG: RNA 3'-terminal phosphate cyclase [Candidatus Methanosuratus sp.]|nr:RNA 3'-terminal phosphate cyclase [Candidatus Methanosuratincola sp.]
MIEIDGSYGEGGGQILRGATFLACVTRTPLRVYNIRARRPKPGLQPQHLVGLKAAAQVSGATLEGADIGSCEIRFYPGTTTGGSFSFEIGTAGSTMLVAQELIPILAFAEEASEVRITGGTDVPWSPPADYFRNVAVPAFKIIGIETAVELLRRGHFPKGGGEVWISVSPVRELRAVMAVERGKVESVRGISHCTNLPANIAYRQASSAERALRRAGYSEIRILTEAGTNPTGGPGSGIVLWAETGTGFRVGADALGSRERRAEEVGNLAARKLLEELQSGMALDSHLADMLIPLTALANGFSKIGVSKITPHSETMIWLCSKFLGSSFEVESLKGGGAVVKVEGKPPSRM